MTQLYNHLSSWIDTGTSTKSGDVTPEMYYLYNNILVCTFIYDVSMLNFKLKNDNLNTDVWKSNQS